MQPVRLGSPSHQNHIATSKRKFQRLRLYWRRIYSTWRQWLVLHQEITSGTKRKGCNCRVWAQEALVIAVKGNTVRSRGIVVDQTEVVFASCRGLSGLSKLVETLWYWSRRILLVLFVRYPEAGLGVYDMAVLIKLGCFIQPKDSCPSGLIISLSFVVSEFRLT